MQISKLSFAGIKGAGEKGYANFQVERQKQLRNQNRCHQTGQQNFYQPPAASLQTQQSPLSGLGQTLGRTSLGMAVLRVLLPIMVSQNGSGNVVTIKNKH